MVSKHARGKRGRDSGQNMYFLAGSHMAPPGGAASGSEVDAGGARHSRVTDNKSVSAVSAGPGPPPGARPMLAAGPAPGRASTDAGHVSPAQR